MTQFCLKNRKVEFPRPVIADPCALWSVNKTHETAVRRLQRRTKIKQNLQKGSAWRAVFSWGLLISEARAEGRQLIGWRGWWVKTEGCWRVWSYELPSSAWLAWNAEGPRAGHSQRPKWPTPGETMFGNRDAFREDREVFHLNSKRVPAWK